jgi:hypothetical protein
LLLPSGVEKKVMVMMKQLKVGTEGSDDRMERLVQPEGFSPTRLKVLVVDDDLLCLMILERMLCQCKYTGSLSSPLYGPSSST